MTPWAGPLAAGDGDSDRAISIRRVNPADGRKGGYEGVREDEPESRLRFRGGSISLRRETIGREVEDGGRMYWCGVLNNVSAREDGWTYSNCRSSWLAASKLVTMRMKLNPLEDANCFNKSTCSSFLDYQQSAPMARNFRVGRTRLDHRGALLDDNHVQTLSTVDYKL